MIRVLPPGAGIILMAACGFVIATLSFTIGLILRSAGWGMLVYFAFWIAVLPIVALQFGGRHG